MNCHKTNLLLSFIKKIVPLAFILLFLGCAPIISTRVIEKVELQEYEQSTLPNIQEENKFGFTLSGGVNWYNKKKYQGTTQNLKIEKNQGAFYDSTIFYINQPGNFTIQMPEASFDISANFLFKFLSLHMWVSGDEILSVTNKGIGSSLFYNWSHIGASITLYQSKLESELNMLFFEKNEFRNENGEKILINDFKRDTLTNHKIASLQKGNIFSIWLNTFVGVGIIPYIYFETTKAISIVDTEKLDILNNHRYSHGLGVKYKPTPELSLNLSYKLRDIIMDGGGSTLNSIFNLKVEWDVGESFYKKEKGKGK